MKKIIFILSICCCLGFTNNSYGQIGYLFHGVAKLKEKKDEKARKDEEARMQKTKDSIQSKIFNSNSQESEFLEVLDKLSKTPSQPFHDPELSEKKLKELYLRSKYKIKIAEVLKIHITDGEEWELYKDDSGMPSRKRTEKAVSVIYKGVDGNCYFDTYNHLVREYEGGGNYSPIKFEYTIEGIKIDCVRAKDIK